MSIILYSLLAIIILALCHLIFSVGRLFEICCIIKDIDEKIDKLVAEIKKTDEEIKLLEKELDELCQEKQDHI